jgi:hypothetical protein
MLLSSTRMITSNDQNYVIIQLDDNILDIFHLDDNIIVQPDI